MIVTESELEYRRYAAFHEAGHALIAWHCGVYCCAWITYVPKYGTWSGGAKAGFLMSVFRGACHTWGGLIASELSDGTIDRSYLRGDDFDGLFDSMVYDPGMEVDCEQLEQSGYLYRLRPVKVAARILDRRYDELCQAAAELESSHFLESRVVISERFPMGRPLPPPK